MAVAKRQVMFRAPCDLHDQAAELASSQGEALNEVLTRALEVYVAGGLRRGDITPGPVTVPDITLEAASTPDITPVASEVISPPAKTQRRERAATVPAARPAAAAQWRAAPTRAELRAAKPEKCNHPKARVLKGKCWVCGDVVSKRVSEPQGAADD